MDSVFCYYFAYIDVGTRDASVWDPSVRSKSNDKGLRWRKRQAPLLLGPDHQLSASRLYYYTDLP